MRVRQPDNQEEDPDILRGRGGGNLGEASDTDATVSQSE